MTPSTNIQELVVIAFIPAFLLLLLPYMEIGEYQEIAKVDRLKSANRSGENWAVATCSYVKSSPSTSSLLHVVFVALYFASQMVLSPYSIVNVLFIVVLGAVFTIRMRYYDVPIVKNFKGKSGRGLNRSLSEWPEGGD